MEILDALLQVGGKARGKSWGIRQWELETINALGMTEAQWVRLGIAERYRKVCAFKLKEWMQILESEAELARIKASGKK